MQKVDCSNCGAKLSRTNRVKKPKCFFCKMIRKRTNANKYALENKIFSV